MRRLRYVAFRIAIHSNVYSKPFIIGREFSVADGFEITTADRSIAVSRGGNTAWGDWSQVSAYTEAPLWTCE